MGAAIEINGLEVGAVRRPGVYVLRSAGRVVWIGAARNPLRRLYAHDTQRRGDLIPALPRVPVAFDSIEIRPCRVDDLPAALAAACLALGWSP